MIKKDYINEKLNCKKSLPTQKCLVTVLRQLPAANTVFPDIFADENIFADFAGEVYPRKYYPWKFLNNIFNSRNNFKFKLNFSKFLF